MASKKKNGFSMIEVLTVIVIIGAVGAILMPSLVTSRYKAIESSCTSNLKNMGYGVEMYCNDSGGYLPNTFTNYNDFTWLATYLADRNVLRCPGSNNPSISVGDPVDDIPSYRYVGREDDFAGYIGTGGYDAVAPVMKFQCIYDENEGFHLGTVQMVSLEDSRVEKYTGDYFFFEFDEDGDPIF